MWRSAGGPRAFRMRLFYPTQRALLIAQQDSVATLCRSRLYEVHTWGSTRSPKIPPLANAYVARRCGSGARRITKCTCIDGEKAVDHTTLIIGRIETATRMAKDGDFLSRRSPPYGVTAGKSAKWILAIETKRIREHFVFGKITITSV